MTAITTKSVAKSFGAVSVLKGIDVEIKDGEFIVVVGPSGCGKSTFLRVLSGLEDASSGQIFFGDREVTHQEAGKRKVAMVFQSYALYPHMSVAENIGFATRIHGGSSEATAAQVADVAKTLQLTDYLDRRPAELSGGQKQRVAIGRAIIRDPDVFLFDEPLSNLDAELRVEMRLELKELHQRLGRTMVYVTHDQVEAMTLADRIVILRDGMLEQVGTPKELYNNPDNLFVAGFLGTPKISFLSATCTGSTGAESQISLDTDPDITFDLPFSLSPNQRVQLGIRPESLQTGKGTKLSVVPRVVEDLGGSMIAYCKTSGGANLTVQLPAEVEIPLRETIALTVAPDTALVFDTETGQRLGRV